MSNHLKEVMIEDIPDITSDTVGKLKRAQYQFNLSTSRTNSI